MKFKVQKEIQRRFDPNTGEALDERPLYWIVDDKTNRKIALMCFGEESLAPLLALSPELFEYVEKALNDFNTDRPFQEFDKGATLLNMIKGAK